MRTAIGAPGARSPRVLVADDERHIARLIQVNLERAGIEVTCAYDGQEALDLALRGEFDALLLDVMMPILNGFEVLKRVRLNPATAEILVIMLTAKAQDRDVFEGYRYGADLYLTKPFNPTEIVSFLRPRR